MRNRPNLELVVSGVVRRALLLAASGGLASACGGTAAPPNEGTPGPGGSTATGGASGGGATGGGATGGGSTSGTRVCDDAQSLFASMNLAREFDYLAVSLGPWSFSDEAPTLSQEFGTCDASCQEAVGGYVPPEDSFWRDCGQVCTSSGIVAYDAEDGAEFLDTEEGIVGLLGPIDTLSEAVLWARIQGYAVSCDSVGEERGGAYLITSRETISDCPFTSADVSLSIDSTGDVQELAVENETESGGCAGRRPEGFTQTQRPSHQVGEYLCMMAELEDAAVEAFARLAEELRAFGAPTDFVQAARAASAEEVEHTRAMSELAQSYGQSPVRATIAAPRARSFFDFALENAVEGCVRETFGAVQAEVQARTAGDRRIAAAMHKIAREEAGHAELSWRIHEWAWERLDTAERQALQAAQRRAVSELEREVEQLPSAELCRVAGLPDARVSQALLRDLQAQLFAPALAA